MIDILMATYNGEHYIEEQIESIINQSYKEWKLYIRDDGSKDKTTKLVKQYVSKYPHKIILIEDEKKGLGAKNNFKELMKYSSSDYCMFSDQDDIWIENKVEISLNKMKELEGIYGCDMPILVHTDLKVVDENKNVLNDSFWKYQSLNANNTQLNKLIVENIVTGCTMILNKVLVDSSKDIPSESIMHDAWIALVASAKGKVYSLQEQTILYRQHSKNEVGAKSTRGIGFIYENLDWDKINNSIEKSINQAAKLYEMYKEDINESDKEKLMEFVNIKTYSFFKRKKTAIKYKLYKDDFKRRVGYLIFI